MAFAQKCFQTQIMTAYVMIEWKTTGRSRVTTKMLPSEKKIIKNVYCVVYNTLKCLDGSSWVLFIWH
jgi:hypothetical protein